MSPKGEGAPLLLAHEVSLPFQPKEVGPSRSVGDAEGALVGSDAQNGPRLAAQRRQNRLLPRVDMRLEDALDLLVELLQVGDGHRQALQLAQVQAHVQLEVGREIEPEAVVGGPVLEHRPVTGRIHRGIFQRRIEALRQPAQHRQVPFQGEDVAQQQSHQHVQARQHVEVAEEPADIENAQYWPEAHVIAALARPSAHKVHEHLGMGRRQARVQRRQHPLGQLVHIHALHQLVVQRLDKPMGHLATGQAVAFVGEAEIVRHQPIERGGRRRTREQLVHSVLAGLDALGPQAADERPLDEPRHERRPLHLAQRPSERRIRLRAHLQHLGVKGKRARGDHPHIGLAFGVFGNEHGSLLANGRENAPDVVFGIAFRQREPIEVLKEQNAHIHGSAQLVEHRVAHEPYQLVHCQGSALRHTPPLPIRPHFRKLSTFAYPIIKL